jgi:hypothetical protein
MLQVHAESSYGWVGVVKLISAKTRELGVVTIACEE